MTLKEYVSANNAPLNMPQPDDQMMMLIMMMKRMRMMMMLMLMMMCSSSPEGGLGTVSAACFGWTPG